MVWYDNTIVGLDYSQEVIFFHGYLWFGENRLAILS